VLRTLNYWKYKTSAKVLLPYINLESYETRSTTTINNHHLFYSDKRYLKICLTKTRPPVTWSSPLYKKIEYLFIEMPIISYSSLWNKLLNNGKKNLSLFCIYSNRIIHFISMNLIIEFSFFFQLFLVKQLMMMMHNKMLLIFHVLYIYLI
jgi:hypothetical protein